MSDSIEENSPCKRVKCNGRLMLSEFSDKTLLVPEQNRIVKQEIYTYLCNKCGMKHTVEGVK